MTMTKATFQSGKDGTAQFKMVTNDAGEPTGEVEFYAAKFGNVDLVGDRMVKGSFAKSLDEWRESGNPIPIVFSHSWADPFAIIGSADPKNVTEDDQGLLVKGMLDIAENPTAKQVHRMMAKRALNEASFAYDVVHETGLKKGMDGANDITEVKLLEVGPTLKGANPETAGVLSAKARSAQTKDGPLPGSIEATQAAIIDAVSGKGSTAGNDDIFHYIVATYTDHAVVATCDYGSDSGSTTKYNSYPYTLGADGSVDLGDPTEVQLQTHVTTVPKADAPDGAKADKPDADEKECDTCGGDGKIMAGNRECPDCEGSGKVQKSKAAAADSDDPGSTLFDLSDEAHATIAVGIVFGAADVRDGTPKDQGSWSYRGTNPGKDLTAAQIAKVVSRVRAAAEKFSIALTADKAADSARTKAGARNSSADQKRLQDIHDAATAMGAECATETKSKAAASASSSKDDGDDDEDDDKDGKDGGDGKDGADGDDGKDGKDGKDGADGKDGDDKDDDDKKPPSKKPASGKALELELLELEAFTL